MSTFDLLKQLQNPIVEEKTPLPKGLKYSEQHVFVEGKETKVHVPKREVDKFVAATTDKKLSLNEFNQLLRDVRGIRG